MTSIDQSNSSNELQQLIKELSQFTTSTKIQALQRSIHFKAQAPRRQLLQALTDRDANVRSAAAEAIEALRPWITDEQWLETLQLPIWPMYDAAIEVLASLVNKAPLKPLLRAATSPRKSSRLIAQNVLKRRLSYISAELIDKIILQCIEYLQSSDTLRVRRIISLEILGIMDDNVPLETFLPFLNDADAEVRLATLDQLLKRGEQYNKLPIEQIAELLGDPDPRVRYRAMHTLETQGDAFPIDLLLIAMKDSDEKIVHLATDILGRRRVIQAIPALLQQLLTDPDDPWLEYTDSAFKMLDEYKEHIPLAMLLDALESPYDEIYHRAIWFLSQLEERTPVDLLIGLLEHKSPATRKQALIALEQLLKRVPIEIMIDKLNDHNREVRRTVCRILRRNTIDIPQALLIPLLGARENIVRLTAIELLGERLPLSHLLAATRDHKWTVRAAALRILGTMGPQVPLDLFLEALCDRNLAIRRVALLALGKQQKRTPIKLIIAALHDQRRVSGTAAEVLILLDKRVPRELLLPLLDDSMAHVRVFGIELLTTIAYDEPVPTQTFRRMLQDNDVRVRRAAILALDQLHVLELATLATAAFYDHDYEIRQTALNTLMKADTYSAQDLELIKSLLGDGRTYHDAIQCLQNKHPEILREVAKEACDILMSKGSGLLLGSMQQEYIAEAIGNMHNPGPLLLNKLVALQDWPYGHVGSKATQALHTIS